MTVSTAVSSCLYNCFLIKLWDGFSTITIGLVYSECQLLSKCKNRLRLFIILFLLFFQMSLLGKGVSGVFYGAMVGLIVFLLKWIGKTFESHPVLAQLKGTFVIVILTILIMTYVVIAVEIKYPNNQRDFTKALTWLHGENGIVAYIFCVIIAAVRGFMLEGPWERESWCFSLFILVQVSFTALFATPDVSFDVSRVLSIHQIAYTAEHLVKKEFKPALACSLSALACLIVMVNMNIQTLMLYHHHYYY